MKYRFLLFLICISINSIFAQIKTDEIFGSWVKTKLTYKDGVELPEENILKNAYAKFIFTVPNKMNFSTLFYENGTSLQFEMLNNEIIVQNDAGSVINSFMIIDLGDDKMVLLQKGYQGFEDPTALKYTFARESVFQSSLMLKDTDIYSIKSGDTIYKQNPKTYANYKGDSFHRYLTSNISDGNYMTGRAGHLVANFVVSKTGVADSLRILESIDKDFDKRFLKVFNKAKNAWTPAKLNGKHVSVLMTVELTYSTFEPAFSAYQYSEKANTAYKEQDYQSALYYYDQALKNHPTDKENLYKRGICKKALGNLAGACEDWKKVKELGGNEADDLLAKYCH